MRSPLLRIVALSAAISQLVASGTGLFAAESGGPSYQLEDVVRLALQRHPTIAGAEGAAEQSRGQRVAAEAYPNPTVSSLSGYGALRDTGRAAIGNDPDTIRSITEYNVTLGQPLEWPAKRAARQKAAEAALAGAHAGIDEAKINLIAEVKIAFYDLLLAQRAVEIAKQNLGTVEEVARAVKIRVKSGEAARFESVKADVEVLKARKELSRASNGLRVAGVALDTLTAGALGKHFTIRGDFATFRQETDLETLTTLASNRHPTLRRQIKSVEQADSTIERERQSRIPDLTVNGGYWREIGREAYGAGLSVPLPFWYQRQGEIVAATGTKHRAEAEYLRTRNELVKAATQHFQEAQTAGEQIELFEKGLLKQADEALRIAQFSFQQGAASLLEVLDAQRVYRQVQLEYAQARLDLSIALARLERATGGAL